MNPAKRVSTLPSPISRPRDLYPYDSPSAMACTTQRRSSRIIKTEGLPLSLQMPPDRVSTPLPQGSIPDRRETPQHLSPRTVDDAAKGQLSLLLSILRMKKNKLFKQHAEIRGRDNSTGGQGFDVRTKARGTVEPSNEALSCSVRLV